MNIAILSLIESILPNRTYFNPYGVLQIAYLYKIKIGKVSVRYSCFSINGMWGGAINISASRWGCGFPLTRRNVKYATHEECIDNLWKQTARYIASSEPDMVGAFQKLYDKWNLLSAEEKFNQFKIGHIYGTE